MSATARIDRLERHWFAVGGICLLPLLLLYLFAVSMPTAPNESPVPLQLQALPNQSGQVSATSRDGRALLLDAMQGPDARAELRFMLPRREPESPHWVVWMRRVPLQTVRVSAGGDWVSNEHSFLVPSEEDGLLPVGYLFRLPNTWEGDIRLELHAQPLRMASLRPEVVSESLALQFMQRATVIAVTAYASLFTLALLALALFFASRDWTFVSFFGFCTVALLQIAAINGHLYSFDRMGVFAALGGGGLNAMSLIFEAASLRILQRYTDLPKFHPQHARKVNIASVVLLLLAGLLMAWGSRPIPFASWAIPLVWGLGGAICLAILGGALRRRVPMAGAVLLCALAIVSAVALSEMTAAGIIAGTLSTYYGYQIAIVSTALMLGVGLISRISKYREQRDREQRAREESERKLYREAVRSELLAALQMGLRGAEEEDIQPTAYRLLLEHLHRIVPTSLALVMTRGYLGRDVMVSWPGIALERMPDHELQRLQGLRQQLAGNVDLQRPVTKSGDEVPVAIEAVVSMPIRAPAWGALVLERSGATAFHPDELVIARELARITIVQVDEAIAAMRLRHTAEVDALTGTLNRRSIDQSLARSFQHSHRTGQPLSVLFVDLDHFKTFNDMLGHACGDHCLRELARVMRDALADEDILGRYGGEEFIVVLPGRQTEMARAVAEQLRVAIEATEIQWNDRALRLTVSVGVATRMEQESQPLPTLERADRALYAAKRAGRNRVQVAPAVFKPRPATA